MRHFLILLGEPCRDRTCDTLIKSPFQYLNWESPRLRTAPHLTVIIEVLQIPCFSRFSLFSLILSTLHKKSHTDSHTETTKRLSICINAAIDFILKHGKYHRYRNCGVMRQYQPTPTHSRQATTPLNVFFSYRLIYLIFQRKQYTSNP